MHKQRLEQLLNFLNAGSTDPFIKYAIATEYVKMGNYEDAVHYYEDLVENNSDYVGTYYHFGKLLELLGRKEDAISMYEKGMNVSMELKNTHAFSELKAVYDAALNLETDDDDWD